MSHPMCHLVGPFRQYAKKVALQPSPFSKKIINNKVSFNRFVDPKKQLGISLAYNNYR